MIEPPENCDRRGQDDGERRHGISWRAKGLERESVNAADWLRDVVSRAGSPLASGIRHCYIFGASKSFF
jgi:hypothetical protein